MFNNRDKKYMKDLIREAEVSKITGLAPGTLRIYRHLKRGPAYFKSRHKVYYERAEVMEWMRNEERFVKYS